MIKPSGYLNGYLLVLAYAFLAYRMREKEETVQDVFNTLSDDDKDVVYRLVGKALEATEMGLPITTEHPRLKNFSDKQLKVTMFLIQAAVNSIE